jgi:hypothetical protein
MAPERGIDPLKWFDAALCHLGPGLRRDERIWGWREAGCRPKADIPNVR